MQSTGSLLSLASSYVWSGQQKQNTNALEREELIEIKRLESDEKYFDVLVAYFDQIC